MHKKKNSASVLAGELILTFYKPKKTGKRTREGSKAGTGDPLDVLSSVFDACLVNGENCFTSESLFNRLVIELWRRRALSCLTLDRREFADMLRKRGWTYNSRTHRWSREADTRRNSAEGTLFDALAV
jgi:hypothetical protein